MAKKSKKKKDETKKVVAKCDTPQESALSQYDIEKLIVTARGEHSHLIRAPLLYIDKREGLDEQCR